MPGWNPPLLLLLVPGKRGIFSLFFFSGFFGFSCFSATEGGREEKLEFWGKTKAKWG